MAGEVTYMNGAQLQAAVQAANQAVAGMSYAEAIAALGGTAQTQTGGAQIVQFPLTQITGGTPVTLEAQYAAQTWEYWQTVGAATGTTAIGAAAGAAVSWAQGALIGTGTGLAATAGLLTLSVPTAVAMAAPLMGVALGYGLYESNPQLWDNIAAGLVDFTTEATQTVSALIDEAGNVLLDSAFVQKLKQIFQENDVPLYSETDEGYSSDLNVSPATMPLNPTGNVKIYQRYSGRNALQYDLTALTVGFAGTDRFITASETPQDGLQRDYYNYTTGQLIGTITYRNESSYTHNGKTVYYNSYALPNGITEGISQNVLVGPRNGEIAWTLVYGESSGGDYPEGSGGWKNSSWNPSSSTTYPTVPVYDPSTGTTRPYYPVTPYIGDTPGTTVDPATTPQQDPTSPITPQEWPVIEPYIIPVVNPEIQFPDTDEFSQLNPDELVNPGAETDPIYIPQPDLDPSLDPSEVPVTESVPQEEGPPPSSGISPPFIFPVPDVPFPSIVPQGSDTPVPSGSPGFIQVYNPTPSEFIAFGRWLWVTYADATIDKIWNNPFDGVIGAHELYATPSKDGYSTIRSGFLDSGISSIIVRQRYTQINCGSIVIPEYWGNYLDYSPYSQAYIYLPFIGIMAVDVDDIVGHAVNVLYHVDSYTGSCIAQITCARTGYSNTLYQFSGDCSVEIPMAGGSQAAIKAAMIGANAYQNAANISAGMSLLGGVGSGIMSGIGGALGGNPVSGIAHGIGQAIGGITSAVSQRAYGEAQHTAAMVSQKSTVQHSGSFGASHGAMGIKKPYIFIRRPIQKVVNNYNKLYGYPAHKMVVIGDCTGYLRCREVHVVSSLATDEEKSAIEQLLKSGVYVTE